MFYDVILRRRNWANAAFCCGAASVHRREAVMQAALRSYVWSVDAEIARHTRDIRDPATREALQDAMRPHVAFDTELTPYKFHVSEDIYTSILLHGDAARRWRSVMHPRIESKMLSPQDMLTWMIQRFKYAAGSLDILFHDNIFNRRRFKLSLPQTLMYATTFWSYLACVWNTVFLISPVIYLFTGIPPVSAWSTPFYLHFLPFFIVSELAFMFGTWGISAWDGRASYLSFFSMNLRALDTVLRGEQIKFHVTPKERQTGRFLYLVKPQIAIVLLTLTGLIWGGIQVARGQVDDPSGYVINIFWGAVNIAAMLPLIFAAMWTPPKSRRRADEDPRRPAIRAQLSHYPHWLPAGFCDCRVGGKTNARARREQRRDDVEPGFSAAPSPARADL
jgi:cellulose synthase (UDP-forming)